MKKSLAPAKKQIDIKFSVVSVKGAGTDECIIEGYANTSTKDRVGDVVLPSAFEGSLASYLKNPVLLENHNWDKVAGKTLSAEITDKGLYIRARISDTRSDLKTMIREGCLSTLSIGYNELDADYDESTKTKIIKALELLEISVVSVPANTEASFQVVDTKKPADEMPNGPAGDKAPKCAECGMAMKYDDSSDSYKCDCSAKQAPKDSMSKEELHKLQKERSSKYGIEVLDSGALTFPAGYPTELDKYGDPVNLKYPIDSADRANNARARFKQASGEYKQESSKRKVHERIVKAELGFGAEVSYDPNDALDAALPGDLKDRMKAPAKSAKVTRRDGESMESCVSRGIATLINEGKDPDQAAAIAYSMCGEKCAADLKVFIDSVKEACGGELGDEDVIAVCDFYLTEGKNMKLTKKQLLERLQAAFKDASAPASTPAPEAGKADAPAGAPDLAAFMKELSAKLDAIAQGLMKLLDEENAEAPAEGDAPSPEDTAKAAEDKAKADAEAARIAAEKSDAGKGLEEMTDSELAETEQQINEQLDALEDDLEDAE